MKSVFTLCTIVFSLFLSSCAFHGGMMTGNANLSGGDFEIISIESGMAKTTQVFGIGGLDKQALVYEAKKSLYRSHPLKKGQAYANVTVDFKRSYFIIVATTIVTITADLVQYDSEDSAIQQGMQPFAPILTIPDSTNENLNKDDQTSAKSAFSANKVVAIFDNKQLIKVRILDGIEYPGERYDVEYLDKSHGIQKNISSKKLYFFEKTDSLPDHNFQVGDAVQFANNVNFQTNGIIIAIGKEKVIAKSGLLTLEVKVKNLKPWKYEGLNQPEN